jgi:hypothetical protein
MNSKILFLNYSFETYTSWLMGMCHPVNNLVFTKKNTTKFIKSTTIAFQFSPDKQFSGKFEDCLVSVVVEILTFLWFLITWNLQKKKKIFFFLFFLFLFKFFFFFLNHKFKKKKKKKKKKIPGHVLPPGACTIKLFMAAIYRFP